MMGVSMLIKGGRLTVIDMPYHRKITIWFKDASYFLQRVESSEPILSSKYVYHIQTCEEDIPMKRLPQIKTQTLNQRSSTLCTEEK